MLDQKDLEMIAEIVGKTVEPMRTDAQELKTDVEGLKTDAHELKLTLENETNRNIRITAEGHLGLSRKLDEALKIENEKEMMSVRVNFLEGDIRRLKDKIATIA
ncbi:MAG: hypothetical protein HFH91_08265 [Lachnospiraceae bacterium]|nr:hypothetical protein [Lachnospiraceae bacterium]